MTALTMMRAACALLACAALTAQGQATRPDPANPKAAVPAQVYRPSLAGYKPRQDAGQADWRAANEGLRPAPAPAPAPASASAPHSYHHHHHH